MIQFSNLCTEIQKSIFSFLNTEELLQNHTCINRSIRELILNLPHFNISPIDPYNRLGHRMRHIKDKKDLIVFCHRRTITIFSTKNWPSLKELAKKNLNGTPISIFDYQVKKKKNLVILYLGDHQGQIRQFNYHLKKHRWTQKKTIQAHKLTITVLKIFNKELFSASTDGTLCIWKVNTNSSLKVTIDFKHQAISAMKKAKINNKMRLIIGTDIGRLTILKKKNGSWEHEITPYYPETKRAITLIEFDPSNKNIISIQGNIINLWNISDVHVQRKQLYSHHGDITACRIHTTQTMTTLITCSSNGFVALIRPDQECYHQIFPYLEEPETIRDCHIINTPQPSILYTINNVIHIYTLNLFSMIHERSLGSLVIES